MPAPCKRASSLLGLEQMGVRWAAVWRSGLLGAAGGHGVGAQGFLVLGELPGVSGWELGILEGLGWGTD